MAREAGGTIGILAAMSQELDAVVANLEGDRATFELASRIFHSGELHGRNVVAVVAGIGKTAAAHTTSLLVDHFETRQAVILTGAAGRVHEDLAVGDIVVATDLIHHDLDVSPLFPRYQVPSLGMDRLPTDKTWTDRAHSAASRFIKEERNGKRKVVRGLVLSGEQFARSEEIVDLRQRFPDGQAVEMEGAAVAQVCIENDVPYAVVRTISDAGHAGDFEHFLANDCGPYASGIIGRMLGRL